MFIAVEGGSGGHAVVVDGYNANTGLFHVDLGWGAAGVNDNGNDDWFPLPTITDPSGTSFTGVETIIYNIDPPAPTVMSVSSPATAGTYDVGTTVPITVTFNEPVTVDMRNGTPQLALNNGSVARYVAGSGSTTLTFDYTVASGQKSTSDLDYASNVALSLDGGAIENAAGNAAGTAGAVTLPATGTDGLAQADIAVNTTHTGPVFNSLSSPTIVYGTATTTLAGAISQVPNGETVSITLDGVVQTAAVNNGAFSSSFNTSALGVSGSPIRSATPTRATGT